MSKHAKTLRRTRRKTDAARRQRGRLRSFRHPTSRIRHGAAALAAATALAAGTAAYADQVRFDNPAHGEPGHFHWAVPCCDNSNHLQVTLPASEQPGGPAEPARFIHYLNPNYGLVKRSAPSTKLEIFFAPKDNPNYAVVSGADAGDMIPTGAEFFIFGYSNFKYPGIEFEAFPEDVQKYLGVKFDLGSGYNYGWIGVVRSGNVLDAFAWGYETEPGVPIPAGAGGGTPCAADQDGDGDVDAADLAQLLGAWGPCDGDCPADFDGDGDVDAADLAQLLGSWGDCD